VRTTRAVGFGVTFHPQGEIHANTLACQLALSDFREIVLTLSDDAFGSTACASSYEVTRSQ